MNGKYLPWVVRRVSRKDRGNGTTVKRIRYRTFAGWTNRSKRAYGYASRDEAVEVLKGDDEIVHIANL